MENKDYLKQLLDKYLDNTATASEMQALFAALQSDDSSRQDWEELLMPVFKTAKPIENYRPEEWEPVVQTVLNDKGYTAQPAKRIKLFTMPRVAAAAAVVLVGTTLIFFLNRKEAVTGKPAIARQDVAPAGDRAMLTLADGRTVLLDSAANGILAQQGNTTITKSADGSVSYEAGAGNAAGMAFNTLSTPRGGKYKITLPDGTLVWLNAATTLRYPVRFAANERKVEVNGEAFFDVAGNARAPFTVVSEGQEVRVLGTQFNLNAYADEADTRTTLLSGSVMIKQRKAAGTASAILKPGQQSQVSAAGLKMDEQADIEQVVAWKNGQLSMQNLDIKAVMRQISRWYDVDVIFEGPLPVNRFGGLLDQQLYLSNIMEVLREKGIQCRLEGKKLYVSAE